MLTLSISVILIIAVFFLSNRFLKIQEKKEENARLQLYMDSERVYYDALANQIQLIREYRHDLAGHIRTLEYLMKKSKRDDLDASLQELMEEHRQVTMPVYCEHEVVNALLYSFTERCRQEQIDFTVYFEKVDLSFIRSTDLNALLHNLLENAVEECCKMQDIKRRQISISAFSREQGICLQVKNTVRENLQLEYTTSKKAKEEHGLGNLVITRVIDSYHGSVTDKLDTNEWSLLREVIFPGS